jgi:tetratricopeptide (TPR) repeat protein/tRNA A-37 threonylcarbamoyl transferase component Bud32
MDMRPAAEQWGRVRALLGEALELAPPAQLQFLHTIEDADLRAEVEAYLAWAPRDGEQEDPLENQSWESVKPAVLHEGSRLANYRLLKELGSGGMGTVYLAERDDSEFEKRVAIKVIQHRLQSDEVVRLFRRERQILATLNHPSITHLVDGGLTVDGRPYLVMEYVDGVPIDAYCRIHKLGIRRRLKLFLPVCEAVQFAHQNLVVHRDLKPANILVTADGIPKLLDFGVARMLHQQADETRTVARLTPLYSSPEHVRGESSGTATDVYSLGVLLFELLTESLPVRREGESLTEFLRALQEDVPARPSETVADERRDLLPKRELRGDLDNIVLHALEKVPARRYSSVENFAADIRRHLDGFPILARPASWSYRAGKFVRRHRTLAAAAGVLAVVGGASLEAVLRSRDLAERQRTLAQVRFEQGRELARFYILDVDRLLEKLPGATPARALITGHTLAYLDRLAPGAEGDVPLQREIATAYERVAMSQGSPIFANMGDRAGALANVEKGIRLRERVLASPAATLEDRIAYGDILLLQGHLKMSRGNPAAATDIYLQATREFETVIAHSEHPAGRLLSRLGSAYLYTALTYAGTGSRPDGGNAEAALPLFEKAARLMPLERKAREGQAPALRVYLSSNEALIQMYWAVALVQLLRTREAEAHFNAALRLIPAMGTNSSNAEIARKEGLIEINYSLALMEQGEVKAAGPHLASSAGLFTRLWRIDPQNAASQEDMAVLAAVQGRFDIVSGHYSSGLRQLGEAIASEERMLSVDRDYSTVRGNLSRHYLWAAEGWAGARNPARARVRYAQALELSAVTADRHRDDVNARMSVASSELGLAGTYAAERSWNNAAHHRELAAAAARTVLARHPDHARARALLGLAGNAK